MHCPEPRWSAVIAAAQPRSTGLESLLCGVQGV